MASKKILIQVDVTTKSAEVQINKVVDQMNQLEGATAKFTETTKKSRAQSGLNNAILIESGRFASDLRYGFTAVANNLGRIIELGQEFSRTEGGGLIPSLKRIFTAQGLFLIGFQLVIAYGDKIFDFFNGITESAKEAAKAQEELNEQLNDLGSNTFLLQSYVNVIDDVNTSEETRKNLINELVGLVPDLEDADFEYGKNLDDVRQKIDDYALSQAARIQIDRLVEENAETLTAAAAVRRISEIKDEKERAEEMRKFLEQQGMDVDARVRERQLNTTSILETETEAIEAIFGLQTASAVLAAVDIQAALEELYEFIRTKGKKSKDREKEYSMSRIDNLNSEIAAIKRIGKIQGDYAVRRAKLNGDIVESDNLSFEQRRANLASELLQNQLALDMQEDQAMKELEALEVSEHLKGQARLNIEAYYDDLRRNLITENSEALMQISDEEKDHRLENFQLIGQGLMAASKLAGETTGAGKALAIAGTLISTYSAAQKAYDSQLVVGDPTSKFRAYLAAVVATAQGLARVKSIMAVKAAGMKESSVQGAGGGNISVSAPDFNVVGQGGVNQLGQVIGSQFGQPIRAYVVSGDISSAQELDRSITAGATID